MSPYKDTSSDKWLKITQELLKRHPLSIDEIREIVLCSWEEIFLSKIGSKPYFIGKNMFPKPQIMGFFLHEIIPLEFENRYPGKWRKEKSASDKDLIYNPENLYSIEIKTSSNPSSIFGNRSYAQETSKGKKSKSGYYLAINFEKFSEENLKPRIIQIRFGWLDHEDWMGQKAATGQQSRLSREVENYKLIRIYPIK